ncbi:MAG: alpha/beta hydrolase fold protein [Enterovirga sp.]|nr:alpha/beta hydrolase fold protein [Enterovirga sp.]
MPLSGTDIGAGRGVVLLHPVGLDRSFWGSLPDRLASTGRRILALDLPGHGSSPPAPRGASIEDYADHVASAIAVAGLGPCAAIGLSFGGMIAQVLALRHPEAVEALVPCGCPGGIPVGARQALRERGAKAEAGGMAAVLDETLERWFTPNFRSDPRVERVRQRLATDDPAGWSAGWHAISGFDALSALPSLRVSSLVVAGECDAATAPEASHALARALPGSRLSVLPGAPHMMQIETEAAYAAAIVAFLDEVAPAAQAS